MFVQAQFNKHQHQSISSCKNYEKTTRFYTSSHKRYHKKRFNKVHVKQNRLIENKIVNNTFIKRFHNVDDKNEIDTIFENIDDLVVIIDTKTLPLDF